MPQTATEPVHGTCTLTLTIHRKVKKGWIDTEYTVRFLPSHPQIGAPAWRLTKGDGATCDVILRSHGPECECPDYHYRQRECKHLRALRAVGLLSPMIMRSVTDA